MADLDWPEDIVPFAVAFYLQPHTGGSESPFSRVTKTYELSAPRWITRMTLRAPDSADRWSGEYATWGERIDAFLDQVKGRRNRVRLWDFRRPGSPQSFVNELAEAGLNTIELTGAVEGDIRVGQYIGGDGRPHRITELVNSGTGLTATVEPHFEADIQPGEAVYENVTGYFRLTSDDAGSNMTEVGQLTQYDLEFVEDWGASIEGGFGIGDELLKEWVTEESFEGTSLTRDANGVVTSATVKWPDGSGGTFTSTTINSTWLTIDAFTITHTLSGKTVTQAAVTRNSIGEVTAKPALTVA